MRFNRRSLLSTGLTGFLGLSLAKGAIGENARQEALELIAPIFQKLDKIAFDFQVTGQEPIPGPYQGEFFKLGSIEYGAVRHEKGHFRRHVHMVEGDIHKTITWGPGNSPVITIGRLDQVNVGYGLGDGMQLMELRLPWCDNQFQTLLEIVNDPTAALQLKRVSGSEDRILELAKDNCKATLTLSAQHGFMPINSKATRMVKSGQISFERIVETFEEPAPGLFVPVKIQTRSKMLPKEGQNGNPPCLVTHTQISNVTLNNPIQKEKLDLPNSQGVVVYDYLNNRVGKYDSTGKLQITGSKLPSETEYSPFVRINLDPTLTKPRDLGKVILDKEKVKPTWQTSLGQAFRGIQEKSK